jgi:hypothetical protein
VVRFVHDQQAKTIADAVHVPVGAFERGDGDLCDFAFRVDRLPTADANAVVASELGAPLMEQNARGNQAECRDLTRGHRGAGKSSLAGTGWATPPYRASDGGRTLVHLAGSTALEVGVIASAVVDR